MCLLSLRPCALASTRNETLRTRRPPRSVTQLTPDSYTSSCQHFGKTRRMNLPKAPPTGGAPGAKGLFLPPGVVPIFYFLFLKCVLFSIPCAEPLRAVLGQVPWRLPWDREQEGAMKGPQACVVRSFLAYVQPPRAVSQNPPSWLPLQVPERLEDLRPPTPAPHLAAIVVVPGSQKPELVAQKGTARDFPSPVCKWLSPRMSQHFCHFIYSRSSKSHCVLLLGISADGRLKGKICHGVQFPPLLPPTPLGVVFASDPLLSLYTYVCVFL